MFVPDCVLFKLLLVLPEDSAQIENINQANTAETRAQIYNLELVSSYKTNTLSGEAVVLAIKVFPLQ